MNDAPEIAALRGAFETQLTERHGFSQHCFGRNHDGTYSNFQIGRWWAWCYLGFRAAQQRRPTVAEHKAEYRARETEERLPQQSEPFTYWIAEHESRGSWINSAKGRIEDGVHSAEDGARALALKMKGKGYTARVTQITQVRVHKPV
jgi:hypothetical protein